MTGRPLLVNVIPFSLREDRLQVLLVAQAAAWELPAEPVKDEESLEQAAAACSNPVLSR